MHILNAFNKAMSVNRLTILNSTALSTDIIQFNLWSRMKHLSSKMCFLIVINCGNPGLVSNSTRTGSDFTIGGTVNYECDTGFNLTGPRNRTCLGSGEWSGESPTCNGGY